MFFNFLVLNCDENNNKNVHCYPLTMETIPSKFEKSNKLTLDRYCIDNKTSKFCSLWLNRLAQQIKI